MISPIFEVKIQEICENTNQPPFSHRSKPTSALYSTPPKNGRQNGRRPASAAWPLEANEVAPHPQGDEGMT